MKILIICPYWLGDGILASAVVNYYRNKYHDFEIVLVGSQQVLELYQFLPDPKQLLVVKKTSSIKYWFGLYKRFKGQKFAKIICFRQSLIIYLASYMNHNIKLLPWTVGRFTEKIHITTLHRKLIDEKGEPKLKSYLYTDRSIVNNSKIESNLVIINPNGSWYGKRWPHDRFVELIQKVLNNPELSKLKFGIIGTIDSPANELYGLISKVDKKQRVKNLIGKYNLLETQELLIRSKLVISNDTAIVHLAAINDIPLIVLWGPTNYNRYSPVNYLDNENIQSIGFSKDYRKFLKKVYFDSKMCDINNYMSHISTDVVYSKFVEIISRIEDS